MYKTCFTKTAAKNFKRIPRENQIQIVKNIEALAASPLKKSNVKKLRDSQHFRLRVGNYRILFDKDDSL